MPTQTGSDLKRIREEKRISLEQVANATRIRLSILRDLEDEEYNELSSSTQVKGFLRIYAKYLGVPFEKAAPVMEAALPPENLTGPDPNPPAEPEPEPENTEEAPLANEPSALPPKQAPVLAYLDARAETAELSASQQILADLGRDLTARRKYLNIPWELITEQTHLPKAQLQALEHGKLESFSSTIQARGALLAYAGFLNLDTDAVLLRFTNALQERRIEKLEPRERTRQRARVTPPLVVSLKRFFTLDLLFGALLVLGILGFLTWGIVRLVDQRGQELASTELPELAEILIGSQTPQSLLPTMAASAAAPAAQLPTPTPLFVPIVSDDAIQAVILAKQTVWIRVIADDEEVFRGRLQPGSASPFTAENYIEIEASNAAAIELILNEEPFERIGDMGQIIRLRLDVDGLTQIRAISIDQPTPEASTSP